MRRFGVTSWLFSMIFGKGRIGFGGAAGAADADAAVAALRAAPEAGPPDRPPPDAPVRTEAAERNVEAILRSMSCPTAWLLSSPLPFLFSSLWTSPLSRSLPVFFDRCLAYSARPFNASAKRTTTGIRLPEGGSVHFSRSESSNGQTSSDERHRHDLCAQWSSNIDWLNIHKIASSYDRIEHMPIDKSHLDLVNSKWILFSFFFLSSCLDP